MASTIAAARHNRKWSWDDDEDDDFDLDTWKATVDTSSPSARDLGPLQLPPCEEKIENVVISSFEYHNYPDEYWETPDSDMQDMAEDQWPIIVSERECTSEAEEEEEEFTDATYTNLVDMILEEQLAIARHQYLTHAIGVYFEGKDEADAPAYPELSPYNGQRYRYAKAFQSIKYANGRQQGEVYRHSPLVLVTGIDDAHLMDARSCHSERCEDDYEEETLEDILGYVNEEAELEIPQVDFTVTFEESPKDANEQVRLKRLPALDHFSQDELKELIGMWKAQQDKDSEDCFDDNEEDSCSIDTWERSDVDEEEEMFDPLGIEYELDSRRTSVVHPLEPEASTYNEEFDFNDVVFSVDSDFDHQDEGYVSSSPPVSPVLDLSADGCEWQREHGKAPARRKGAVRVDSMDALDELGAAEEFGKTSACSGDEDLNPAESRETSQVSTDDNGNGNGNGDEELLDTVNHAKFADPVTSHRDNHNQPFSTLDTIRRGTTDVPASLKTSPTHANAPIYTHLEQASPRHPFQIQISSLTNMFFNGLALHPHVSLDEQ